MASADFCGLTRCITAKRAVWSDGSGPIRSLEIGLRDLAPGRFGYGTTRPFLPSVLHRQGAQISPGKNANYRCTSAAFTVGCVPVGFAAMCQLASHPSALYAVSVRRLAPLALRLPPYKTSRPCPCVRLVVILALMTNPGRYSHRGFAPHKFAPMLGAHPSSKRTGLRLAAHVKR